MSWSLFLKHVSYVASCGCLTLAGRQCGARPVRTATGYLGRCSSRRNLAGTIGQTIANAAGYPPVRAAGGAELAPRRCDHRPRTSRTSAHAAEGSAAAQRVHGSAAACARCVSWRAGCPAGGDDAPSVAATGLPRTGAAGPQGEPPYAAALPVLARWRGAHRDVERQLTLRK
jgi:hypothetical protein